MKCVGHVARVGERNIYILFGNSYWKIYDEKGELYKNAP